MFFCSLPPAAVVFYPGHRDGNVCCLSGSIVGLLFPRGRWILVGFVPYQQQLLFLFPRAMPSKDSCSAQMFLTSAWRGTWTWTRALGQQLIHFVLLAPMGSIFFFFLFGGGKANCIHSFVHSFWFFKIEVQLTHISFSCTTWWFNNSLHYEMLTMITVVTICHHRKWLQYYWLYSIHCQFHPCDLFIL